MVREICEELRDYVSSSRDMNQENFAKDIEQTSERLSRDLDLMFRDSRRSATEEAAAAFKSDVTNKITSLSQRVESTRREFDDKRRDGLDHPWCTSTAKEKYIKSVLNGVQVEVMKMMSGGGGSRN